MRIEHTEVCQSCSGTGLYRGMAERDGFAVVCSQCKGTGAFVFVHEYEPFKWRKPAHPDVKRVVETNPGIILGTHGRDGEPLPDFGGQSYQDWADGKPFPRGSEMRNYTCPRWWTQCLGGKQFDCDGVLVVTFSKCRKFPEKHLCWAEYDKTNG